MASTASPALTPVTRPVYKAVCQRCIWERADLDNARSAENAAIAHGRVNGHDVEIRYSIVDQLIDVVRVRDGRD